MNDADLRVSTPHNRQVFAMRESLSWYSMQQDELRCWVEHLTMFEVDRRRFQAARIAMTRVTTVFVATISVVEKMAMPIHAWMDFVERGHTMQQI